MHTGLQTHASAASMIFGDSQSAVITETVPFDRALNDGTQFIFFESPMSRNEWDYTGVAGLLDHHQQIQPMPTQDNAEPDVIARYRDDRLELMIKRFEGDPLAEDEARIVILTNRLRKLVPRVTSEAWEMLEQVASDLESDSAFINELEEQFGSR